MGGEPLSLESSRRGTPFRANALGVGETCWGSGFSGFAISRPRHFSLPPMAYACATRGPARLTSVRKTSAAGRNGARQRVVASSSSTATATLVEAKRIYEAAFASLPHSRCMQLAQGSSKRNEQNDEWFYGELDFSTFAALLSNLSPGGTGGESFVDLGSGAGKAVAVAALTQAYKSCIGVERKSTSNHPWRITNSL